MVKHLKRVSVFFTLFLLAGSLNSQVVKIEGKSVDFAHGKLRVANNDRFLEFSDGTPFMYLGDTAWELFHRLTKTETEKYLENRRQKGFTVIQAVVLAELDGLNTPNAEGERPLIDNNPETPNPRYFEHIDWVVKKAEEKGLFIGMLPTWGDKVDKKWGDGPVIFNEKNAAVYGKFIGNHYKNSPNIIWIMGGDRTGGGDNFAVWNAMAEAIKSVDPNHLMTFHPWGECSSSEWFHHCEWLDFNMTQTGHNQRSYGIYKQLLIPDYQKIPQKPVLDGEPRYEDHPVGWNPDVLGWFDDADVRQAMYWSLFSGAFGHTYGCHAVWQMLGPGRQAKGQARNSWLKDLDLPGARQLIYARNLLESRPFLERVPFQMMVKNEYMQETDYIVSTRGKNYIFVYIPTGIEALINMSLCGWQKVRAWWFNPRNGDATDIGTFPARDIKMFTPPEKGRGKDWILVLDNQKSGFKAPGIR
jgi:hypothetical protein